MRRARRIDCYSSAAPILIRSIGDSRLSVTLFFLLILGGRGGIINTTARQVAASSPSQDARVESQYSDSSSVNKEWDRIIMNMIGTPTQVIISYVTRIEGRVPVIRTSPQ